MRKNSVIYFSIITAVVMGWSSCKKSDPGSNYVATPATDSSTSLPMSSPLLENFEVGAKDTYDAAIISLSSGKWSFDNAVLGSTAEDTKNGTKAVRIQEAGTISMNFDIVGGVVRVAITSGVYGTDGPSTWQLWASDNSGATYTQVGSDIITSGLQHDTIVISTVDKIRFAIKKTSGGSNRLNIDDFDVLLTSGPLAPNVTDNNNMLLGNPTNATLSPLDIDNYYMDKTYYSLAYSKYLGIPVWVSWHIGASDFGSTPRQDDFRPDDALPATWYHVSDNSYSGSGFDRGHQCPSNDRTASVAANSSTFLMTNMIPQAPNVNQGVWQEFEDSCHQLVVQGKELYVICGSYGVGGTGNLGLVNTIDDDKISVPAHLWKIAVVLPNGNGDLSRINASTRIIAVDIPNDNNIAPNANWKNYRVSVHDLEVLTGYDFLSNLPVAIQQQVELVVDNL